MDNNTYKCCEIICNGEDLAVCEFNMGDPEINEHDIREDYIEDLIEEMGYKDLISPKQFYSKICHVFWKKFLVSEEIDSYLANTTKDWSDIQI